MLAMVLYPDVQKKAQAEIDLHCSGRLPTFADFNSLTYCHAIVKEILRWNPVVPLGMSTVLAILIKQTSNFLLSCAS
jgi:cytochrome P450